MTCVIIQQAGQGQGEKKENYYHIVPIQLYIQSSRHW